MRARAQIMHFATSGALEAFIDAGGDLCENVLQLCEPSVLKYVDSLDGMPNIMVDMLLRAAPWDSRATATLKDKAHLRELVSTSRDAGTFYMLGWGSEVSSPGERRARMSSHAHLAQVGQELGTVVSELVEAHEITQSFDLLPLLLAQAVIAGHVRREEARREVSAVAHV